MIQNISTRRFCQLQLRFTLQMPPSISTGSITDFGMGYLVEDGERAIVGWKMGDSSNLSGLRRLRQFNESSATMAAKP